MFQRLRSPSRSVALAFEQRDRRAERADDRSIVNGTVRMAHELGLTSLQRAWNRNGPRSI
jgi:hypothetical protein